MYYNLTSEKRKEEGETLSPAISSRRVIVHKIEVWQNVFEWASFGEGHDSLPRQRQGFEKGEEGDFLSCPPFSLTFNTT